MIRSLWMILSTIAIANIFAVAFFIAWLAASDRLDAGRIQEAKAIFVETRAVEAAREKVESRRADAEAAELAELAKQGQPPITAEQRSRIISDYVELINQRTERTRRETQNLIDTLLAQQARLKEDQEELQREREAFESMRAEVVEREGSEQFAKALKIYESVKAETAVGMLRELITDGQTDQVVSYLNAMKPRSASAVIATLEDDDPALAADLLERLRVHGLFAQAREAE